MRRFASILGLIVVILLAISLAPVPSVSAAQYYPPWADRFTFNYPDGGLDTTIYDSYIEGYLEYAGYNAFINQNAPVRCGLYA